MIRFFNKFKLFFLGLTCFGAFCFQNCSFASEPGFGHSFQSLGKDESSIQGLGETESNDNDYFYNILIYPSSFGLSSEKKLTGVLSNFSLNERKRYKNKKSKSILSIIAGEMFPDFKVNQNKTNKKVVLRLFVAEDGSSVFSGLDSVDIKIVNDSGNRVGLGLNVPIVDFSKSSIYKLFSSEFNFKGSLENKENFHNNVFGKFEKEYPRMLETSLSIPGKESDFVEVLPFIEGCRVIFYDKGRKIAESDKLVHDKHKCEDTAFLSECEEQPSSDWEWFLNEKKQKEEEI